MGESFAPCDYILCDTVTLHDMGEEMVWFSFL